MIRQIAERKLPDFLRHEVNRDQILNILKPNVPAYLRYRIPQFETLGLLEK
jgi:hypothetical protein